MQRAAVLATIAGALLAAQSLCAMAQTTEFRIDNVSSARKVDATRLPAGAIEFSDQTGSAGTASESALMPFDEWANRQPIEKKFLALFPNYVEPLINAEAPYRKALYVCRAGALRAGQGAERNRSFPLRDARVSAKDRSRHKTFTH